MTDATDACLGESGGKRYVQTRLSGDTGVSPLKNFCEGEGIEINRPRWPDLFGAAVQKSLRQGADRRMRVLSLFSGGGGLDIGFHDSNFDIVECVELEREYCETLRNMSGAGGRMEGAGVRCTDIRDYSAEHLGDIDFVIGGPPCQTFSAAGRRANGVMGTDDSRGMLFKEYVRILGDLSPRGFLFENVYGITGAQGGGPWREITDSFSKIGYRLHHRVLDSADYGVPQHRERLIIVGLREGGYLFPRPTHGPDSGYGVGYFTAKDAIDDLAGRYCGGRDIPGKYSEMLKGIPPGLNYSFYTEEMGHPAPLFAWRSKFSDFLYKADPGLPVRTIKAQGGQWTGPIHWDNRHFTIEELKRLQTFPDDYIINGGRQTVVHQIGNSVPPQFSRILALSIADQVFGADVPFEIPTLSSGEELGFRKRKRDLTERYRRIATDAISMGLTPQPPPGRRQTTYYSSIASNFKYSEGERDQSDYSISIKHGACLEIDVAETRKVSPLRYSIKVSPVDRWIVGSDSISLNVYSDAIESYTVAWKALEKELRDTGLKDDLVQLNGYYQYAPKIRCRLETYAADGYLDVMRAILEGDITRRMIRTHELAEAWKSDEGDVIAIAESLKRNGYEIRNSNTNPQIDEDTWLIPYAFPTLTPLSVQLNKPLR